MNIREIDKDKKRYLDLLLIADEQEDMIDRYLDDGKMFVLEDDGVKAECVVVELSDGVYELKNIAVYPEFHRNGYGKKLIDYIFEHYSGKEMYVGTGDVPWIINFYKKCGFKRSHTINNFFTENYDHPIIDSGVQLIDMIYLKREW